MELRPLNPHPVEFLIGYLDAFGIDVGIEFGFDFQAGAGGGASDQIDDHFVVIQRLAPPVHTDMTEHAMLDLIPFAGSWREMADRDAQPRLVSQPLQGHLPQPNAGAVASATVRGHQQGRRVRITDPPHFLPPPTEGLHGKLRRVAIDAHAHPTQVGRRIVNPVGMHFTPRRVDKVVDAHQFRLSLGMPFPPPVLEVANPFLLLRIDLHHEVPLVLKILDTVVDVPKLRIAIRMTGAFLGLLIALQAIAQLVQQGGHRLVADRMPLRAQRGGQLPSAPTGPAEGAFGIAARRRFDEPFQRHGQSRPRVRQWLAAAAPFPNATRRAVRHLRTLFQRPLMQRGARQARGLGHDTLSSIAQCLRRHGRPHPTSSLVQHR